jgi:sulfur carrier protein
MQVTINGKNETFISSITLARMLASRNIDPQTVVVEVNLDIIPREQLESTPLKEGDAVEILRFVGGG